MKKSLFDKMSDSYENFHLKELRLGDGADVITVSPKLKLGLGWSLFVLCCVLAYIFVGLPFVNKAEDISKEEREAVLKENINVDEEHDTIIPYEKDANESLNEFVTTYFKAITSCDYLRLQDMVMNADEYRNDENLKRKAEFITNYENITVYTKAGLNEDSYITFVVANLTIAGVNSSPYDIIMLYIVNGERGYMINNGELAADVKEYIEKVKGDADIQKVYKAVEEENAKLKEKDASLREFYEIISRRNVQTQSAADQTSEEIQGQENASENTEPESKNGNSSENPDQSNAEEDNPEN